jgi:hypothetical protein
VAIVGAMLGCGGSSGSNDIETVFGESQTVDGLTARTSAVLLNGEVTKVVTTVPRGLLISPPEEMGDGPAGSFLSLDYPAEVRNTTFLNNMQVHFGMMGHPPEVFQVPHFDIHAYSIPEADIFEISGTDTEAPAANRVAAGYHYDGVNAVVPEMGVHALREEDLEPPFTEVMVLGFWHGSQIFVEPMITQAQFENKAEFTLPIGAPAVIGRSTLYPTRFTADYDEATDTYSFTFDEFVERD